MNAKASDSHGLIYRGSKLPESSQVLQTGFVPDKALSDVVCLWLEMREFVNGRLSRSGNRKMGGVPDTDRKANCAHFVLNSTSLHLIPAYSSQSSLFP
jgi:hypothetical protein